MCRGAQAATDEGDEVGEEALELRPPRRYPGRGAEMPLEGVGEGLLCQVRGEAPAPREGALIDPGECAAQQRPEQREALLDDAGKVGRAVERQAHQEAQFRDAGGEVLQHPGGEGHDERCDDALERRRGRLAQGRYHGGALCEHRRLGALEQRADEAVAGGKVVVQGGDAVTGLGVDGAQGHRIDAALGEQALGGIHDGLAAGFLGTAAGGWRRRLTFDSHNLRLGLIT